MTPILTLILINIALLARTIKYHPVVDDIHRFKHNLKPDNTFWSKVKAHWQNLHSSRQYILDTRKEHAINIIIHTTVVVLIYLAFGANHVSFLAALSR